MKSSVSILIVIVAILFTGCSNETEDTVKKEPPTTTQEANAQLGNPATIGLGNSSGSMDGILDAFCWEETCTFEPEPPDKLLQGVPPLVVNPGDKVDILVSSAPSSPEEVAKPDSIIISQSNINSEESIEVLVENDSFIAPKDPGRYYYTSTAEWNEKIKGTAVYAHSLLVKED